MRGRNNDDGDMCGLEAEGPAEFIGEKGGKEIHEMGPLSGLENVYLVNSGLTILYSSTLFYYYSFFLRI